MFIKYEESERRFSGCAHVCIYANRNYCWLHRHRDYLSKEKSYDLLEGIMDCSAAHIFARDTSTRVLN